MKVELAYGQGHLPVEFPDDRSTVIVPAHTPGLPDERAALAAWAWENYDWAKLAPRYASLYESLR